MIKHTFEIFINYLTFILFLEKGKLNMDEVMKNFGVNNYIIYEKIKIKIIFH